jgi:hypothetical protein
MIPIEVQANMMLRLHALEWIQICNSSRMTTYMYIEIEGEKNDDLSMEVLEVVIFTTRMYDIYSPSIYHQVVGSIVYNLRICMYYIIIIQKMKKGFCGSLLEFHSNH